MKLFLISFFLILCCPLLHAQGKVTSNVFNGDTTVSTDFETLYTLQADDKATVSDNVVGVRNISGKKNTYWLFFYFIPYDIQATGVNVSNRNYAYLKTTDGKWYRMPYKGKSYYYSTKAKVGFFIDISNYVADLQNQEITEVRLETSVLYHTIKLNDENRKKIASIVAALVAWH